MSKITKNSFFILVCFLIYAPIMKAQIDKPFVPCQVMPDIMTNYYADHRSLSIAFKVDFSPEKLERFEKLNKNYLEDLNNLAFEKLSHGCKADYILFKRDLEENLRRSGKKIENIKKISKWFPFADEIYNYARIRREGKKIDAKNVALDFQRIIGQIKELEIKLENEKDLTIPSIHIAIEVNEDLKEAIESIFEFYNGYDPLFSWWVPVPYQNLQMALEEYTEDFRLKLKEPKFRQDKSGIVGNPVGREELIQRLEYNLIPYTPEELIEIAKMELAWSQREILAASDAMGFGNNWKKASEEVKETYVKPGEQPQMIRRLFEESLDFIKKHDLLTIPPLAVEVWGLRMMSAERQLVNPFFTGGTSISISYPTNTMEIDDRMMSMRGNNPHFSRATVHHEAIAGHHFQSFMNNRNRVYRQFDTPFWHEGNALYWEFLLYELGFPETPEDKIGMLFWRMHRSARIIFSLNFHLGNWTPQECIDFLVERVNFERRNAEAEVRRSFATNYSPLYQLAYMVGGLQFYALKEELVTRGEMTLKQYHDSVVKLNAMPVEMVRAILKKQDLNEDFETKWRFYEFIQKKNLD